MNLFSKGTLVAGLAAAMFACGGSAPDSSTVPAVSDEPAAEGTDTDSDMGSADEQPATAEQIKCSGINECKGKAECGGDAHSCKGQNECAGKGWVMASAEDCEGQGGSVVE